MTEHDCTEHFFFGDDVCASFNHHDSVFRAAEVESKARFCALCAVGIDDVLAVHHADHNRTRRTCPRNVAYRKCDGRTDHAENFGRNVGVNAQNGCNDRNVVVKSLREERTNRSVDKTRSEDRFVACSALSLFESAGDFADCVHFLFVVNAQREKVHAVAGALLIVALTITTVSPQRTMQEPLDCPQYAPVSTVISLPPTVVLKILFSIKFLLLGIPSFP